MLDDVVAGAVTGWLPFGGALEPLVRRMSVAVRHEHARRHSIAMKAAERRSGMSREDLEERIASDPDLVPIAVRVLHAAGSTGDEKLLKLLGAALGCRQPSDRGWRPHRRGVGVLATKPHSHPRDLVRRATTVFRCRRGEWPVVVAGALHRVRSERLGRESVCFGARKPRCHPDGANVSRRRLCAHGSGSDAARRSARSRQGRATTIGAGGGRVRDPALVSAAEARPESVGRLT